MAVVAEDGMDGRIDRRANWRDWSPVIALAVGFLGAVVSILAVGIAILGAIDGMRTEIGGVRTELKAEIGVVGAKVDELAAGQAEIRERLARVEAQLEVLSGEWPPARRSGADR